MVVWIHQPALGGAVMPDILSQGGDREPSRWPRRLALIAAVVLVVALIVQHVTSQGRTPGRSAAASPSPPTQSAVAGPVATGIDGPVSPGVAGAATFPSGISGHTAPWSRDLRLLVGGTRPAWFWPATGRTTPVPGLPPASSGYELTRVEAGWVMLASPSADVSCASCAAAPVPVYFLADGARAATPLGDADEVAPGAAAGAVWLTTFPAGADMVRVSAAAQEYVRGKPAGPPVRLPAGYVIDQATSRGLLLEPVLQQPGAETYKLWDPDTQLSTRVFEGVVAASPSEIAWAPRCATACTVRALNLTTGHQTVIALPGGSSAADAAFSPDGRFLALELSYYDSDDDGALAVRLDVAPLSTGIAESVPQIFVSSDAMIGFGWPTDTDSLVAELSFTTAVQVISWSPGAARLAVATVRMRQVAADVAVGQ